MDLTSAAALSSDVAPHPHRAPSRWASLCGVSLPLLWRNGWELWTDISTWDIINEMSASLSSQRSGVRRLLGRSVGAKGGGRRSVAAATVKTVNKQFQVSAIRELALTWDRQLSDPGFNLTYIQISFRKSNHESMALEPEEPYCVLYTPNIRADKFPSWQVWSEHVNRSDKGFAISFLGAQS